MALFKRKNKKQTTMLDDVYTIRFELEDEFAPENNDLVKEKLDLVSNSQRANGEPALADTLPFATFKSAEDFFSELRSVAASSGEAIKFKYLAIWEYNHNQKVKPGKPGLPDGNPHEWIVLADYELGYDYQNFTKALFEDIFNNPENTSEDYESKVNYCKTLGEAYMESCGVGQNEVATLPDADEASRGEVTLAVPSFEGAIDADNLVEPVDDFVDQPGNAPDPSSSIVYDPASASFSQVNQVNVPMPEPEPVSAQPASTPQPEPAKVPHPQPQAPGESRPKRAEKRSVIDEVNAETLEARTKAHIEAPQFQVEELDLVEPGQHGYVEYRLNQKKKSYNRALQLAAQKVSEENEKQIIANREKYRVEIQNVLSDYFKRHEDDSRKLFSQIEEEFSGRKIKAIEVEEEKINEDEVAEKADAKRAYEKKVSQIEADAEANRYQVRNRLETEYQKQAQKRFQEEGANLDQANGKNAVKLEHELDRKYETKARIDANELRASGAQALKEAYETFEKTLDELRTNVTNEHMNAKQTQIAQDRAEAEKVRMQAPYQEVREQEKTISDLKSTLAGAEANRDAFKQQSVDLQQRLNRKNKDLEALEHELEALKSKQASEQIQAKNTESNDNLNNYLNLLMAENLLQRGIGYGGQPQVSQVEQEAEANKQQLEQLSKQYQDQVKAISKGSRRLGIGFGVILLAVVGGFSGMMYHQNQVNQQQVEQIQKQMEVKVAAAKQVSTPSASEVLQKATEALHANNLTELEKYPSEKYYALDKAIIQNNASAANATVQALGNDLAMGDRYRASQAESLLKTANNQDLANKVADANK
ncbi:hypothetical protein [Limosilactobacillus fermentum]|uniref:hypothetical protein n=1 Tax=Limosilactobacillus fermentum TaxID=1613 RepID=UPI000E47F78A|nr:hypothetical protein [Limosilactobacillus fermentum]MCH5383754.1 hypothetical protein [Limosilactobacillus fermentum]RGU85217.1 hypothetical protein DWW42_07435 [Limosilactobacillus fermentum]